MNLGGADAALCRALRMHLVLLVTCLLGTQVCVGHEAEPAAVSEQVTPWGEDYFPNTLLHLVQ